jgi:hypothetical protein
VNNRFAKFLSGKYAQFAKSGEHNKPITSLASAEEPAG